MKAAIYCRLSEEDKNKHDAKDDSASIQNQKAMLIAYASQQNWEIYDIYSDDDYAGADRRRPEFNRLLRDAETRKFDIILCKTQSRFTRELELVEKYIHGLFPLWGVRFISIVDNADTDNKGNKKSRQINGLVNEWYVEDMSENIRSVLDSKRQKGHHIGSFALYGYKKDPDHKGHLLIDEEAAAIVREVFTLFSQGYGKTAIARTLNDRGVPNPTEYKRLKGLRYKQPISKNGKLWKYFAISDMLTNEIYIGNMVQGKYGSVSYKTKQNKPRPKSEWFIVENTHDPIIDRPLWDKVQDMIRQKAKPFASGQIGLFARKARCAHCGYVMRSTKSRGKHYLICSNRHVSKDACIGSFISVDKLEEAVLDELHLLINEYLDVETLKRNVDLNCNLNAVKERCLSDLAAYEKRQNELSKIIRELYIDKTKGILRERDYLDLSADFAAERDRLERAVAGLKKQLLEIEENFSLGDNHLELIQSYTNPKHLSREMVEVLIDHICVEKRPKGSKNVPVTIYWNF